jgi:hypothetical protein
MGVGSGWDEQSELARSFGHPISDGLKKIAAAEGLIGDDEDPGHRSYLQVWFSNQTYGPEPPVSLCVQMVALSGAGGRMEIRQVRGTRAGSSKMFTGAVYIGRVLPFL